MNFLEVYGQRRVTKTDRTGKVVSVTTEPRRLRFQSLYRQQCEAFVSRTYREEKVLCEIRGPGDTEDTGA